MRTRFLTMIGILALVVAGCASLQRNFGVEDVPPIPLLQKNEAVVLEIDNQGIARPKDVSLLKDIIKEELGSRGYDSDGAGAKTPSVKYSVMVRFIRLKVFDIPPMRLC